MTDRVLYRTKVTGEKSTGRSRGQVGSIVSRMEKNPKAAESKETLLSLQELEPSPVDEDPIDIEKGDYFDTERPSPPPLARSSTLGLSGHSTVYWCTSHPPSPRSEPPGNPPPPPTGASANAFP